MTLFLISFLFKNLFIYLFWVRWVLLVAHGILVPQPGIEPMPPALEVWSLNHWTTREVSRSFFFKQEIPFLA